MSMIANRQQARDISLLSYMHARVCERMNVCVYVSVCVGASAYVCVCAVCVAYEWRECAY